MQGGMEATGTLAWNGVSYPAGIYLFKVYNRKTRTRCEICSNLTTKTPEWCQWRHSRVFIVNFNPINPCGMNLKLYDFA